MGDLPSGDARPASGSLSKGTAEVAQATLDQELFDDADGCMLAVVDDGGGSCAASFSLITSKLDECLAKLSDMTQAVRNQQANAESTGKLQQAYQSLVEQFHEREVLQPIFLQLIAIADRCRQKITRLEALLAKPGAIKDGSKRELARYLVSTRRADLTELENILASFGVAPFEHPDETFDRNVQFCLVRSVTERQGLTGKIARRLRPGYRRNAQVIRPEFVAVYVPGPHGSD